MKDPTPLEAQGFAGRLATAFIDSKLTPLLIIGAVLLGIFAVVKLPREEEPQIKVPMIDVMVSMPGATAKEVEEQVTRPMEKLLWEISGVEYVYSISSPGESLVIVRFQVGHDEESALVRLNQKLQSNYDRIPPGVSQPLVKASSIDDVPVLALTLHSSRLDPVELRRLAAEVEDAVKQVPDVAETRLIGGQRRNLRAVIDPVKLASRELSLAGSGSPDPAGQFRIQIRIPHFRQCQTLVESGAFLTSAAELGDVVVGVHAGRPVYLRDVADYMTGRGCETVCAPWPGGRHSRSAVWSQCRKWRDHYDRKTPRHQRRGGRRASPRQGRSPAGTRPACRRVAFSDPALWPYRRREIE
ncbi:MAG: efflux RND transporter permease subunit [Verrucomicrobiales bacterium]